MNISDFYSGFLYIHNPFRDNDYTYRRTDYRKSLDIYYKKMYELTSDIKYKKKLLQFYIDNYKETYSFSREFSYKEPESLKFYEIYAAKYKKWSSKLHLNIDEDKSLAKKNKYLKLLADCEFSWLQKQLSILINEEKEEEERLTHVKPIKLIFTKRFF